MKKNQKRSKFVKVEKFIQMIQIKKLQRTDPYKWNIYILNVFFKVPQKNKSTKDTPC